jgi:pimeloyl-ACP methyl ester carboxylesterase
MNDPSVCSPVSCPTSPLSLAGALERFKCEASRGVCDTGRYRCSYYTWGEGPPLLFIHGLSDNALSFVPLAALLSSQFRCIAYDLPSGKGDGARLKHYRHVNLAADARALLHHLEIRQSYVYGASFGSLIALLLARDVPEQIPRLILQGGFARRPLAPAERWLARLSRFCWLPMSRLPLRRQILSKLNQPLFPAGAPEVWDFFLTNTGSSPIAAVAHRALLIDRCDLRESLGQIRQPVLLVCGDVDPVVNNECEEVLLQGLPRVARAELSQGGHFAHLTHTAAVAEVVRRFLTPSATGECPHQAANTRE